MSQAPSLLRRVLANTGVLIGGRGVNAVLSLGYLAVAARALGVREVGVLILINAFAQLVAEVVKFNSWQTLLHYGARPFTEGDRPGFQRIMRFTLFLDLASSLAGAAIAVSVALTLGELLGWRASESPLAALYGLSVLAMAPATPTGVLRLIDRFDLMAFQAPLSSAVRLLGSLGLWATGAASLAGFLAVWAAGTLVAFVYLAACCWSQLHKRGMIKAFAWSGPLSEELPGAWRFAWATNLSTSLDAAFTHAVTLVVGAVLGPAPAALWRIGRQVADAIAKPARLLIPALYPELARLHAQGDEGGMRRLALQVGLVGGAAGALMLAVTAVAGRPLLGLVMGPSFEAAASLMTLQVAAAVIAVLAIPLEPMLVSLGRPGDALKVRAVVAAILLAVLPPSLGAFGIPAAGWGLIGAMAALALGQFWLLRRPKPALAVDDLACADGPSRVKGEAK